MIGIAVFNEAGAYPWTDRGGSKAPRGESVSNQRFATPPNESRRVVHGRAWRTFALHATVSLSMPKFYIKTYGCQMNERDSEQVAHSLIERGYEPAPNEAEADVVLLEYLQRARHGRSEGARQNGDARPIGKRAAGNGFWFSWMHGAGARRNVVARHAARRSCRRHAKISSRRGLRRRVGRRKAGSRRASRAMDDPRFSIVDIEEESGSQETIRDHEIAPRQATAFVSIMQGCNMHCTFCIVPQTRGAERSRSIEEIVSEVRELVGRGVKEVTLLGQIVNLYGRHEFPKADGKSPFVQLLEAVHEIDGLHRIRFTSPHPIGFRDDLLGALRVFRNWSSTCTCRCNPARIGF